MTEPHRNVAKKHFCPGCDHFHPLQNNLAPTATGICMFWPPTGFVVGMAAVMPAIARDDAQPQQIPIVRAYYPPVGPNETCAQWTPRAEGEA